MKVLVVGGGGREHAIIKKLKLSPIVGTIYCAPGNGGIQMEAECFDVKATDIDGVVALSKKLAVDLVVVAPDDPLVLGMVDALEAAGIKAFGPRKDAAALEGSKVFSKAMMKKYGIPTAAFETFTDSTSAVKYLKSNNKYPIVLKVDGLALGKGVIIAKNYEEAKVAVYKMMEEKSFGESGSSIVIEEFLEGVEVTVLAFTDSKTVKPMVSSMDHKRAHDNDEGLNTGGMGTIAPSPFYTEEVEKKCMERIFQPTVDFMRKEGKPFKGCLYFGLMITKAGDPYVIEYNCRFGDPEAQVVLPLLDGDLANIMLAVCDERLADASVKTKSGAAACVILASGGYPVHYSTGYEIQGLSADGSRDDADIIHAGTKFQGGKFATSGGRVIGVTAEGYNLKLALEKAYAAAGKISFHNMHYRKDIGKKAVERE